MRNITVTVDEETHRIARIRAAELDTSVSAVVRGYLRSLASNRPGDAESDSSTTETEKERRARVLDQVIAEITADGGGLRMADNLSREELYDRGRAGAEASAADRETPGGD